MQGSRRGLNLNYLDANRGSRRVETSVANRNKQDMFVAIGAGLNAHDRGKIGCQ